MLRIALFLLAAPHTVFLLSRLRELWYYTPEKLISRDGFLIYLMLLADVSGVMFSIFGPINRWLVWGAAFLNLAAIFVIVIGALLEGGEAAEGLGMLVASGWVIPILGPFAINAVFLCLMVFFNDQMEATIPSAPKT